MVAAHERELQRFARMVAYQFERIVYGRRTAHIKMHAPFHAIVALYVRANGFREVDFFPMQVLRRKLRQGINLTLQHLIEASIAVAEVNRRIPHLQIEIRRVVLIKQIAAVTTCKHLGRVGIVHGIAV